MTNGFEPGEKIAPVVDAECGVSWLARLADLAWRLTYRARVALWRFRGRQ